MRRRTLHAIFAATALACGLVAGWHAWRLQRADAVNAAIAAANAQALDPAIPEARFARATALAAADDREGALKAYQALIQGEREDLRIAALYNVGNLHLREALKGGREGAVQSLPLIELAKQSYRNLLRSAPDDWDARYNLERALWLAPEVEDVIAEDLEAPTEKERALTTMQGGKLELP